MSPLLIDFIENFYQRSCQEIVDAFEGNPESLLMKKDEFLGLLRQQTISGSTVDLPKLAPGELRPVIGNSVSDLAAGGIYLGPRVKASYLHDENAASFSLDVRSLLLYAHTVALPDPFGAALTVAGSVGHPNLSVESHVGDSNFLYGLELLSRLSPLITHGVVFVIESQPELAPEMVAHINESLDSLIPKVAIELVRQQLFKYSDQADLYVRARSLAERFIRQDMFLSEFSGEVLTRLLSCQAEKASLPAFAAMRPLPDDVGNRDPRILDELVVLQLQGAGRIKLSDIISIRDDSSFAIFRRDMAEAVAVSAASGVGRSLDARRTVVADEIRAAGERLKLGTKKSDFLSSTLGDAISWAVGAVIGGVFAGWPGAMAGLAAKGIVDIAVSKPSAPKRALRAHYVELSRPLTVRKIRPRDRLLRNDRNDDI